MGKATITFVRENDDGDEIQHELPATWVICCTCNGAGSHSQHMGAITQDDRDRDWDDDSWDNYMAGGYDRPCRDCGASGKVLEVDEDRCDAALLKQYQAAAREEREFEAICRAERAMGA